MCEHCDHPAHTHDCLAVDFPEVSPGRHKMVRCKCEGRQPDDTDGPAVSSMGT